MPPKLSPHVTIYKFPITAVTSILTRLSGLYLTGLYIGGGLCCLGGVDLRKTYTGLESYKKRVLNYSILFPTSYHTFSGVRHFVWDAYPHLLKNKSVARSSYILIGSSLISTIVIENSLEFILR